MSDWEYDPAGNRIYLDGLSQTMIYTELQKKQLADEAVAKAEIAAKIENKPLDEAEKERLWNLVKGAVEGG